MARFFSFHAGRPLNLWERCCLRSFVDHGHQIELYAYEQFDVPAGVALRPAQEVIPLLDGAAYLRVAGGWYAHFADYFRYCKLRKDGGWWVDTDVLCLSSTMPEREIVIGWEDEKQICNAIMKFPPEHPLIANAIAYCIGNAPNQTWGHSGPMLLTRLAQQIGVEALPPPELYPIHYWSAFDLLDDRVEPQVRTRVGGAPLLHIWHSKLRWAGFESEMMPLSGSYLGRLFLRHGDRKAPQMSEVARDHIDRINELVAFQRARAA